MTLLVDVLGFLTLVVALGVTLIVTLQLPAFRPLTVVLVATLFVYTVQIAFDTVSRVTTIFAPTGKDNLIVFAIDVITRD